MTEEILTNIPEEEEGLSREEMNELKRIRYEKLEALKAEGKNPFEITKFDFNTTNTALREFYEAEEAKVLAEAG